MRRLAVALAVLLAASCAGHRAPAGPSPAAIVIENATGERLALVAVEEWPQPDGRAVRMGSVSPVPKDASQVVARSASSRPLPREVRVAWVDHRGVRHEEVRALDFLVADFATDPRAALVFRIRPHGILEIAVGAAP